MLTFKKISAKNFLSVGNNPLVFEFNRPSVTLVTGKNGEGKSVFLDALCFALFGVSYRKIKKDNLINNYAKRACEVEMWFEQGGDEWHIKRTIKPNSFVLEKNSALVDKQTSTTELQEWFESSVIKMNMPTFCQIVILGSANFTPFMQLTPDRRREVVDPLLDIVVFGEMGKILKEHLGAWEAEKLEFERKQEILAATIKTHEIYRGRAAEARNAEIEYISQALAELKAQIIEINATQATLEVETKSLSEAASKMGVHSKAKLQLASEISVTKHELARLRREREFFANNSKCPQCHQEIDHEHAEHSQSHIVEMESKLESKLKEQEFNLSQVGTELALAESAQRQIEALSRKSDNLKVSKKSLLDQAERLIVKKKALAAAAVDEINLESLHTELGQLERSLAEHLKDKTTLDICNTLLKDTGIKAAIIKNYIPIINSLVCKYLSLFEFYPKFEFDENFQEKITIGPNVYEYNQFSMGQRMRLNLAMLFTWREIARLRAQSACNLLVFDEIFDSSLDAQGADDLMTMLDTLDGVNTFIISHRGDQLIDKVDFHVNIEKHNGFSTKVVTKGIV